MPSLTLPALLISLPHFQTCRDDACQVKGCAETKRLLVHVRSCPSGPGCASCPSAVKGCSETRKLLAHYRKCKDARTRSVGSGAGRRGGAGTAENCLVCSLMARYAKNQLDRMQSSSLGGTCVRISGSSSRDGLALLSSSIDRYSVEPGLVDGSAGQQEQPVSSALRSTGLMPPPPPRSVPVPGAVGRGGSGDSSPTGGESIGSPPNPLELMSSKMAMLARVASMDPEYDPSSSTTAAVARSVDAPWGGSARGVTPEDDPMRDDDDDGRGALGGGVAGRLRHPPPFSPARKRSSSYDGREPSPTAASGGGSRVTFCRNVVQTTYYPTERAIREEPLDSDGVVDLSAAQVADGVPRPRSASCGNMSASSGSLVCSREEPLDAVGSSEQEEMFQMD